MPSALGVAGPDVVGLVEARVELHAPPVQGLTQRAEEVGVAVLHALLPLPVAERRVGEETVVVADPDAGEPALALIAHRHPVVIGQGLGGRSNQKE